MTGSSRRHPAFAPGPRPLRRDRPCAGAGDVGRCRGDLSARRRPYRSLCRRTDRGGRRKDRKTAPRPSPQSGSRAKTASVIGLDDARKSDAPIVFENRAARKRPTFPKVPARRRPGRGMSAGRRGRSRRGPESASLARRRMRCARSAAGRGDFPDRHATACLPGAACHRRPLRRRSPDRACLDAGRVRTEGAIAKRYKLDHDKVRVIADHVGGGFGSKGSLGMETIAAIELARGQGAGQDCL